MQYFKGDITEKKYYESGKEIMDNLSLQRNEFFDDAYACQALGDLIVEDNRSPLATAMPQQIFRESYPDIVQSFIEVGTFESYLSVFRKIFGEDVGVEFTVPDPGKLNIAIEAEGVVLFNFAVREIVNNQYEYFDLITQEGETSDEPSEIMFQTIKGFESQYELERMLFEMVPAGIYTTISLTLGE